MTLGRTASNAIKIKTDGGLRAVNCACCGGCGCSLTIPESLRDVFDNATSATLFGYPSLDWMSFGAGHWVAIFDNACAILGECDDEPYVIGTLEYFNGCLSGALDISATHGFDPGPGFEFCSTYFEIHDCPVTGYDGRGTFSINGVPGFEYQYLVDDSWDCPGGGDLVVT